MVTRAQLDAAVSKQFASFGSRRPVAVQQATPLDADRLCDCWSDTFGGGRHPVTDAMYPDHWTPEGRVDARQRQRLAIEQCPPDRFHLKAVDEHGRVLGYCKWHFKLPEEDFSEPKDAEGPYWNTEEDRVFANWFRRAYTDRRTKAMQAKGWDEALFAIDGLTVLQEEQYGGIGTMLVQWGTGLADEFGVDCTVESALGVDEFYQRCGFVVVEPAKVEFPPQYADKETQESIWMVRKSPASKQA